MGDKREIKRHKSDSIPTDIILYILNSKSWRWNTKIKSIRSVNNDRNIKASLLQVFTGQFVSIQVQYWDFISTTHEHKNTSTSKVQQKQQLNCSKQTDFTSDKDGMIGHKNCKQVSKKIVLCM